MNKVAFLARDLFLVFRMPLFTFSDFNSIISLHIQVFLVKLTAPLLTISGITSLVICHEELNRRRLSTWSNPRRVKRKLQYKEFRSFLSINTRSDSTAIMTSNLEIIGSCGFVHWQVSYGLQRSNIVCQRILFGPTLHNKLEQKQERNYGRTKLKQSTSYFCYYNILIIFEPSTS